MKDAKLVRFEEISIFFSAFCGVAVRLIRVTQRATHATNATSERIVNDAHSNERSDQLVVLDAVVIYETCRIIKVVYATLEGNFGGTFELR